MFETMVVAFVSSRRRGVLIIRELVLSSEGQFYALPSTSEVCRYPHQSPYLRPEPKKMPIQQMRDHDGWFERVGELDPLEARRYMQSAAPSARGRMCQQIIRVANHFSFAT
jgi:hypothetical protein